MQEKAATSSLVLFSILPYICRFAEDEAGVAPVFWYLEDMAFSSISQKEL